MERIVIVGCGKKKRGVSCAACDLYTGVLSRARRAYAEASGERWAIASAQHGLVVPTRVVDPYDTTMADRRGRGMDVRSWALRLLARATRVAQGRIRPDGSVRSGYVDDAGKPRGRRLERVGGCLRAAEPAAVWPQVYPLTLEMHAGREYVEPVLDVVEGEGKGEFWRVEWPVRGMGIGEQLAWYKERRGGAPLAPLASDAVVAGGGAEVRRQGDVGGDKASIVVVTPPVGGSASATVAPGDEDVEASSGGQLALF